MSGPSKDDKLLSKQVYPDLASAHKGVICAVLEDGVETRMEDSLSIGANRSTRELSNYQLLIRNPAKRMMANGAAFSLIRALARFLWLGSANDRLADISIYDPGAARFSDDGLRIPGSNFGTRLFCPRPGLNPVERIVDLLHREHTSRRATIPIFSAEDVGRDSKDIPCAIATHFRICDSQLNMTLIMRSNNGFRLFPYNAFEFSMLQEVIARQLKVEVGTYTHYALSMHIYSEDLKAARLHNKTTAKAETSPDFSKMPETPAPLEQIKLVAALEAKFRNAFVLGGPKGGMDVIKEASDRLCEYWLGYLLCLALELAQLGQNDELTNSIGLQLQKSAIPFSTQILTRWNGQ